MRFRLKTHQFLSVLASGPHIAARGGCGAALSAAQWQREKLKSMIALH